MGFPCLIDKRFCKTLVKVAIESAELDEDGELIEEVIIATHCNLQMGARASFTKDKEKIELAGVALFIGDLCPMLPIIASGTVLVGEQEYSINKGTKNYNPDGTVNYTTLELI